MCTFEIVSMFVNLTMGKEVVPEIKDNFLFYTQLLQERKSIFDAVIDIAEIGNNNNTLEQKTNLQHINLSEAIEMIVNVKINNHRFFQFKLRCRDLSGVPFFRYDSDGETHRNYTENIPLSSQQVTTPHFHQFNEEGICVAYKTEKLLNEDEMRALEDINLCVAYFCQISNIWPVKDDYPTITINSKELPLELTEIDPLLNVNF